MAHINEAPRLVTGAPREACSSGTAEHSLDTKQTPFHQDETTLADLDACIETAEAYERVLALKQFRVRKLILNLKCKRDALADLGAVLADRRAA